MTVPPRDARQFQIDERGVLRVPREVLEQVDLGPKMRVSFRVEGKSLVIEKAAGGDNPLDAAIGRKVDRDLFGKIQQQQARERDKARELFDKGIAAAGDDPEPPDHPFRRD